MTDSATIEQALRLDPELARDFWNWNWMHFRATWAEVKAVWLERARAVVEAKA